MVPACQPTPARIIPTAGNCDSLAAIANLFRRMNRYVGNLPPMPGVFPDYPAPVIRNAGEAKFFVEWKAQAGIQVSPTAGSLLDGPLAEMCETTRLLDLIRIAALSSDVHLSDMA
jgi:hypothetical protein